MSLQHLGIIADGNRRWAKAHGLPTIEGHKKGLEAIKKLVKAADEAGVKYLTFYVFSTENWGRSTDEVSYIMKLAETRILKYAKELAENNARMLILGSKNKELGSEGHRIATECSKFVCDHYQGIYPCIIIYDTFREFLVQYYYNLDLVGILGTSKIRLCPQIFIMKKIQACRKVKRITQ